MAKKLFSVMLELDDIELLKEQAKRQNVTPSALARILISDGLMHHGWHIMQLRATVNHLVELVRSDIELSAAAVAASALLTSKGLEQQVRQGVHHHRYRFTNFGIFGAGRTRRHLRIFVDSGFCHGRPFTL